MIFKTDGVISTLDFSLGEVLAEEVPGTVASRVLSLRLIERVHGLQEQSWDSQCGLRLTLKSSLDA